MYIWFLFQALVFNSEKSAGVSEEIPGMGFLKYSDYIVHERGTKVNTHVPGATFVMVSVSQEQPTVVVEDLRLCTVKPSSENERRFCFEVVSPSK